MLADEKGTVWPGCRDLVDALDAAASSGDVDQVTRRVQVALSELATAGGIVLPEELRKPSADAYARRLIYSSAQPAFTVLAMVWGPGQGTPVHDHSGMWCVEGVIEGQIDVTQYDLVERQGERCRFDAQETIRAGIGSSGRLIPPFDYHTIANAAGDDCAITIHAYGGEMVRCMIYERLVDNWYLEHERALAYTD